MEQRGRDSRGVIPCPASLPPTPTLLVFKTLEEGLAAVCRRLSRVSLSGLFPGELRHFASQKLSGCHWHAFNEP